jgi:Ser/Thr protein kinase RdoA (MazF antagonist)
MRTLKCLLIKIATPKSSDRGLSISTPWCMRTCVVVKIQRQIGTVTHCHVQKIYHRTYAKNLLHWHSSIVSMEWVRNSFGLEPQWTLEPDIRAIESLAQKHLGARNKTTECRARFYAGGAFNKLFLIESSTGNFIMRVSMPVCPTYKTRSEVSTILWLRKRTQIPVPAIIAYDDTSINELGFEWILMEMMPGQSLYHRWRQIPIEDKENLVRTLAGYQYDLLSEQNRSRSIGNIYHVKDVGETLDAPQEIHCTEEMRFHIGRMVSLTFFWGDQAKATIPRGPFRNSLDWLQTRLDLTLEEQQSTLKHLDDEDDIETAEKAITLVKRLFTLLPAAFASQNPEPEQTALWHHDLSLSNILINDKNEITAIVDWECVSVQPLWRATQVPPFLVGRTRLCR